MSAGDDTLKAENADLRLRLEEAEETIRAIQSGAVDAFVVADGDSHRVYTLDGADRPYRLLVEEMQQGAATLQGDGTINYANQQLAEMLSIDPSRLTGTRLRDVVAERDRAAFDTVLRAAAGVSAGQLETVLMRGDGTQVQAHLTFSPLPPESGAAVGVLVTDLTNQKHHEHLKVLVDELNHRVKNTLASVQSIAQQTLKRTVSPHHFVASFDGRIQALARVHTMLSGTTWQGADLGALIRDQIVLGALDGSRLSASGPPVMLDAQLASHIAMVMYELGTNAIKYGALSGPRGSVGVIWEVEGETVQMTWSERGGPPIEVQTGRGFGSTFIEQTLKSHQGTAEMQVERAGVTWLISFPVGPLATTRALHTPAPPSAPAASANPKDDGAVVQGKRVLVIEDETLVAMHVIDMIKRAEGVPIGPAGTVGEAIEAIGANELDAALVDANLGGVRVDKIAEALAARDVPFVFVSGYDRSALPDAFQNAPLLSKPFSSGALMAALAKILAR